MPKSSSIRSRFVIWRNVIAATIKTPLGRRPIRARSVLIAHADVGKIQTTKPDATQKKRIMMVVMIPLIQITFLLGRMRKVSWIRQK